LPFPTFFWPAGSNAGPPAVALEATATGEAAGAAATALEALPETNPHPVFPACVCAPRPEQMPLGPAQHVEAQSDPDKHCPPMNWSPAPFPTFLAPAGSKAGPPADAVPATAFFAAAGAEDAAGAETAEDTLPDELPDTKPQPVLPAWVCAPSPLQIPEGPAQHVDAQSAPDKHCPPINCFPCPLPTFFAPAGSKAGPPAEAVLATETAAALWLAGAAADEPVEPKPQPVFPFCVDAPGPEHIPVGFAQHPLPQSALLKPV
jgi:hypothetical protein